MHHPPHSSYHHPQPIIKRDTRRIRTTTTKPRRNSSEKLTSPATHLTNQTKTPYFTPPPSTIYILKKSQVSDLTITTAERIQYSCFLYSVISDAYILFRVVLLFIYMPWNKNRNWNNSYKQEKAHIEWTTFNSKYRRYIDIKNDKLLIIEVKPDNLADTVVKLSGVPIDEVTLLSKSNQPNLSHRNHFLRFK